MSTRTTSIMTLVFAFIAVVHSMTELRAQGEWPWELMYPRADSEQLISTRNFIDVAFFDEEMGFVVLNHGLLATDDGGRTWRYIALLADSSRNTGLKSITFVNRETIMLCGVRGLLFRSTDGGATWEDRSLSEEYHMERVFFIDEHTGWMGGGGRRSGELYGEGCILKSTNGGMDWNVAATLAPEDPDDPHWVYWYDIQFVDADYGFAVGSQGAMAKSTDGGDTWELMYPLHSIQCLSLHALDRNKIIVGGETGHLFSSSDAGETWDVRRVQSSIIMDICFLDEQHGMFANGNYGVVRSTDGGESWFRDYFTTPVSSPGALAIAVTDMHIWAVGRGTIYRRQAGASLDASSPPLQGEMRVSVYPSPMHPGAAGFMNVTIPHTVPVDIEVYDLLGRVVTRIRSGVLSAGSHMFTLNAPSVTGVYILLVSTPREQYSQSFVVTM